MKIATMILALAAVLAAPAQAADDAASKAVKDLIVTKLGVTAADIRPAPAQGLYEVQHGHDFAYVTTDGKYLLRGDLVDMQTGAEVTENRRRADRLLALKALGDKNYILFAPPPPIATKHTVTVFTDVDCGYCRRLHSEMAEYNAKGIAIRYAFYPRSGPDTDSWYRAEAVWCSADRKEALTEAKQGVAIKIKGKTCANPVAEEYKLAQDFGIRGTPLIVLPNGDMFPGYVPPKALAARLAHIDAEEAAESKPQG